MTKLVQVHLIGDIFEVRFVDPVKPEHFYVIGMSRSEDLAVQQALSELELAATDLKERRLLIRKAPDLPLGA